MGLGRSLLFAVPPHPDANQHRSGTVGAKQGAAGTNRNMLRAHVFRAKQERKKNMAKIVKKSVYKTVSFGSNGYNDLNGFSEVAAEFNKNGELRLIDADGSWRLGVTKNLYTALGSPTHVKVLMSDSKVAFKAVPEETPGAYEFGKGAIIYSVNLAEKIMALVPNVDFKRNATTRCGHIEQVQTDEEGSVIVILGFN